ncbi:MAG: ATP-binding protein [Syntrophobacteraceae bacterium]
MRLTIFARVMIAQSTLIALVMGVSLYALGKLQLLTELNSEILLVDAGSLNEEKRLLKTFLTEMRNGEKYLISQDQMFYDALLKGTSDFNESIAKLSSLVDSDHERKVVDDIKDLHTHYLNELQMAVGGGKSFEQVKTILSENIIEKCNELIRIREQSVSLKTAAARDQAADTAQVMLWLTPIGIAGALLLAYIHARSISSPIGRLIREMRRVGKGEFSRTIEFDGPKEVQELAQAFNRMAEELAHLDKLKADFTAHVSHELRTPLTAIREGTSILLDEIAGPLTPDQREILDVVQGHGDRLFRSISSILDLSKMEAEMMEYELTICDLRRLMQCSAATVELIARKKNIQLQANLHEKLPMLMIDECRVQQVLDNLLSNAVKFTPEGGGVFMRAITREAQNGRGRMVEVIVADEGPGIPKEDLDNIFKQFYQSANSKTKSRQGTGLGLAIARHIINAHGGEIWAESEMGRGSTFHFTLPVASGHGEKSTSPLRKTGSEE